ncbi:unnamed protein product [Ectocarpus fasciculatus]
MKSTMPRFSTGRMRTARSKTKPTMPRSAVETNLPWAAGWVWSTRLSASVWGWRCLASSLRCLEEDDEGASFPCDVELSPILYLV